MGLVKQQQVINSPCLPPSCHAKDEEDNWKIMEGDHDGMNVSSSQENSSISSNGSISSSSEMADDASSPTSSSSCCCSSSSSSSSNSKSPLFDLADLMADLPIKRGLSKYYEGKSQSFTSLSDVSCMEDLVKKEVPYRRKLKASRSYGNGLDAHKPYTLPKAIISKKISRGSVTYLSFPSRKGSFLNSSARPPLIPVQKKF